MTAAGPALLALVLCLVDITGRSLGFDESASVTIALQHGGAFGHAVAHDGGNMSAYYVLLHAWLGLAGRGILAARLPSSLGAAAAVAVCTRIGVRTLGRGAGLLAGLLLALSLPLVFWGQSARSYALLIALVAGSFLALLELLEAEGATRAPRIAWMAYALCTVLALYMSYTALLVLPVQAAAVARCPVTRRRVALALLACAACCTPLVVLALGRGSGQLFWLPRPDWKVTLQALESLTGSGLEPSFRVGWPTWLALVTGVGLTLAFGAATLRTKSFAVRLIAAWTVIPFVLALLESMAGRPVFIARNLLVSLPAVALLLAWGLTHPRLPRPLAAGLAVALLAGRVGALTESYGVSPEDSRAATAYVLANTHRGDCAAFYPADVRMGFAYYLRAASAADRAPTSVLPPGAWTQEPAYVEDYRTLNESQIAGLPARCPRLWLISSHEGQPDGPPGSRANRRRYLRLRRELGLRYRSAGVSVFGYAGPIRVQLFTGAASSRRR